MGPPDTFDQLLKDVELRRLDVLVVWKLDRLGRSLRRLIPTVDELTALGVGFVGLNEGIDTNTPAGRLQLHILGAIAEFERERIRERVGAGMARVRAQGKRVGKPRAAFSLEVLGAVKGLPVREAAARLGTPPDTAPRDFGDDVEAVGELRPTEAWASLRVPIEHTRFVPASGHPLAQATWWRWPDSSAEAAAQRFLEGARAWLLRER